MYKKLDVVFVVDCSERLKSQKHTLERMINDCVHSMKNNEILYGVDVFLSLVSFSDEVHRDVSFEFKPLKDIGAKIDLGEFSGLSNPGPVSMDIVTKVLRRYNNWRDNLELCRHPILFFITDGLYDLIDEYQGAYEKVAEYIKEKEGHRKLNVFHAIIGNNDENAKLTTSYHDDILTLINDNAIRLFFCNWFSSSFRILIPGSSREHIHMKTWDLYWEYDLQVFSNNEKLEEMFKQFNEEVDCKPEPWTKIFKMFNEDE